MGSPVQTIQTISPPHTPIMSSFAEAQEWLSQFRCSTTAMRHRKDVPSSDPPSPTRNCRVKLTMTHHECSDITSSDDAIYEHHADSPAYENGTIYYQITEFPAEYQTEKMREDHKNQQMCEQSSRERLLLVNQWNVFK